MVHATPVDVGDAVDFEPTVVGGVLVVVLLEAAEDAQDGEGDEDADPLPGLDSPRSISGTLSCSACLPWTDMDSAKPYTPTSPIIHHDF